MEKEINIGEQNEFVNSTGVSKGHGTEGVITRWGIIRLPRKTHRGLRKVKPVVFLFLLERSKKRSQVLSCSLASFFFSSRGDKTAIRQIGVCPPPPVFL